MNPLRLHRETIFSMRSVSVWSLFAIVLGREFFPAGREETGETPQGKVFLKGQRKECPPEVLGIYNSAGCLFRRLGNNRGSHGGCLRKYYEGNFNRNWCCWGVSCSANVDFAFNGRPDLSE